VDDVTQHLCRGQVRRLQRQALPEIVRRRRQKPERCERGRQAAIDAYVAALGGLADLPPGQAAIARASAELAPPV